MTPLHELVTDLLSQTPPCPTDRYIRGAVGVAALRANPNARCLNCGTSRELIGINASPLSVCRTCLGE